MLALAFLLPLLCAPAVAPATLARARLDGPALDVAFLDETRLLVLSEDALHLYRVDGDALVRDGRLLLPGERVQARWPAGLLRAVPGEGACWAMSNRRSGATLFTLDGQRLAAVAGAEAIPPTALPAGAAPEGVRFLRGSNTLALGASHLLRLVSSGAAIAPDGTLLLDGQADTSGTRAGDALADLSGGVLATTAPSPPSETDEIRLLRRDASATHLVLAWPEAGRVRALAALPQKGRDWLAVATDTDSGSSLRLVVVPGTDR